MEEKVLLGYKCPVCGDPLESIIDMGRHVALHAIHFDEKRMLIVEFHKDDGNPSTEFDGMIRTKKPQWIALRFPDERETRGSHYSQVVKHLKNYIHKVLCNVYAIPEIRKQINKYYGNLDDFLSFIYVSADFVVEKQTSKVLRVVGGFMIPDTLIIVLDIGSLFFAEAVNESNIGKWGGWKTNSGVWKRNPLIYALFHELVHRLYKLYKHGKRFRMMLHYFLRLYATHVEGENEETLFSVLTIK